MAFKIPSRTVEDIGGFKPIMFPFFGVADPARIYEGELQKDRHNAKSKKEIQEFIAPYRERALSLARKIETRARAGDDRAQHIMSQIFRSYDGPSSVTANHWQDLARENGDLIALSIFGSRTDEQSRFLDAIGFRGLEARLQPNKDGLIKPIAFHMGYGNEVRLSWAAAWPVYSLNDAVDEAKKGKKWNVRPEVFNGTVDQAYAGNPLAAKALANFYETTQVKHPHPYHQYGPDRLRAEAAFWRNIERLYTGQCTEEERRALFEQLVVRRGNTPEQLYNLGFGLIHNEAIRDIDRGLRFLQTSADGGNAFAARELGEIYEGYFSNYAPGVQPDIHEALKWYRLAGQRGNRNGQMRANVLQNQLEGRLDPLPNTSHLSTLPDWDILRQQINDRPFISPIRLG